MRFAVLFILLATTTYGQQFKKLKVGFGFGAGIDWPKYEYYTSNATIVYLEPSYRINDRFAVGFRLESASTAGIIRLRGGSSSSISSYGLYGQYYFSDKMFRLFAGLGVGFYHPELSGGSVGSSKEETSFGFYPRVGFDYGHFSFTVDYNIVSSSQAILVPFFNSTPPTDGQLANSYGSVKMGVLIGGGRKKSH